MQEPKAGHPARALERVHEACELCDHAELSGVRVEQPARVPCLQEEVDGDRGLVREEAEELHLVQAEERALGPVEDLEHAERRLVVEERRRHQTARDVAGALRDVPGEAGILADVLDDERRPRREHPAGDALPGGEAHAEQALLSLADDGGEDELLRLRVEQQDRRRASAEDRARHLHDRGEERAERLLRADDARGHRRAQLARLPLSGHVPPPTLFAIR